MRGILVGVLALAALEAAVSSQAAAQRAGGILTFVGKVTEHFLNPTLPAIPDLSAGLPTSGGGSTSSSSTTTAAPTVVQATQPRHATPTVINV